MQERQHARRGNAYSGQGQQRHRGNRSRDGPAKLRQRRRTDEEEEVALLVRRIEAETPPAGVCPPPLCLLGTRVCARVRAANVRVRWGR
jgi:hypothetical protein